MSIAATIILGLVQAGTSIYSGYKQQQALDVGEGLARREKLADLALRKEERLSAEKLARDQMRQNQRQFEAGLELSKEQLAETKNVNARTAFRNQFTNLTGILDKNEQLKNLYTSRLKALRN